MDVQPMPGLEHLPFAEVWFETIDDEQWVRASARAAELAKEGLEVWTTTRTPEVADFLVRRGYDEVRRYVISELDVATAADLGSPALPLVTFAERPDLGPQLYAVACESYPDQPGRSETVLPPYERWRSWGLDPHPPETYFIALESESVLGYGYLEVDGGVWKNGFMAVARAARGRGVAGAIKRAQIAWSRANGVATLRAATETRLTHMRALNARCGYRSLHDEIVLRGPLAS
jgi:GNAT superfamily N-acetyltransferase